MYVVADHVLNRPTEAIVYRSYMPTKQIVPPRRTPISEITWQIDTKRKKWIWDVCFQANTVEWLSFLVYVGGPQAEILTKTSLVKKALKCVMIMLESESSALQLFNVCHLLSSHR